MNVIAEGTSPTYSHYPDNGCEVSPSCLSCPLPLCRYDDPQGYENWKHRQRRARAKAGAIDLSKSSHGTATRLPPVGPPIPGGGSCGNKSRARKKAILIVSEGE